MQTTTEAENNLRVIRTLMEKATIYRAVSAPGALVGGACSLIVAGFGFSTSPSPVVAQRFFASWASVLILTAIVNLALLRRDAGRRGEPFFSSGMKLALRAMLPALIAGGLSVCLAEAGGPTMVVSLWVLLYGVSLLAASHFAPKAIRQLGRAFFVTGAVLLVEGSIFAWWNLFDQWAVAYLMMGGTFGLFHLVYAICTWPRKVASEA